MTRRKISILIALVMANYLLLNIFARLIVESNRPAPTPTRTPTPVPTATSALARGNSPTPTTAPAQPTATNTLVIRATPTERTGRVSHQVQPGETLESIAALYGSRPQDILNLNGLSAPEEVQPGQELLIPAPGETVLPISTPTPQPRPAVTRQAAPSATPTTAPQPTPRCAHMFCTDPPRYGEVNKGITQVKGHFQDAQGNPLDGYFVLLSCPGDYHVLSSPSGPWSQDSGKERGAWEITLKAVPLSMDCDLQAVMYKCTEWFNSQCSDYAPLSAVVPIHTSAESGETIVIVDWICYDNCLPGIQG